MSTKYCVFSAANADNNNANSNNIIFAIKDTKLYVPVVTLSVRDDQKLSNLLSKESERSVYWNEYKTKNENKNTSNECRYFLESNFIGVDGLLVLVYSSQDENSKKFKVKRYYLPKRIIKNYNVMINEKNVYDQPIDSNLKQSN